MFSRQFFQGLLVTGVVSGCMLIGFTYQESLLRHRYTDFYSRVDAAVELALVEKEKRVKKLEAEVSSAGGS